MLERRAGYARIVEAEGDAVRMTLAHGRELGVVGVVRELRIIRQRGHGGPPPLGHELELAVAVELVTEQVGEADRPGSESADQLRQSRLVDLEQAEVRVAGDQ